MEFASPIITPVVESLIVPIKKHLGFLVSSTKYVREMKTAMEKLNRTEQDVQDKKKVANLNNHMVSHQVSPWLEGVKEMKEKVQNIPEDGNGCFNVVKKYKSGKQSYAILQQIKALKDQEAEIRWTNQQIPLAKVPSTSVSEHTNEAQNDFPSRNLIFKHALKSLQPNDESHKMIALCGMGGIGKTTMMEKLKKAVEHSKMFDWVVKVVVGENNDVIALQRAIAQYIGKDLDETAKDARADRLRKKFEEMSEQGQKKILVIMDDVWKQIDLKDVGLTSPFPNGLKLLFTSRFEGVCTQMGVKSDSIIRVDVLKESEAKALFFEIVGTDGDDPELHKIGELIVKKCGGLPIVIETIAKNLTGTVKDAWKEALSNLQHDNFEDLEDVMHKVFEMSYNNLKKEDFKSIFLLCGLFPDDFDISIGDLVFYGWQLRLFTDVRTLTDTRRRVAICVDNLTRANLLTKSDLIGCIKMHDLVRAFVLSNFTRFKQVSIPNLDNKSVQQLTKDANESYQRILLKCTGMSELPANIHERTKQLEVASYENILKHLVLDNDKIVDEVVFEMDGESSPLLPYLEQLELSGLEKTSHVWKCNNWNKFLHQPLQHFPFQNLTNIYLEQCPKIKYLISPLIAIYLSNLKTVKIESCVGMEEVISRRDDANEENTTSTSFHRNTTFFPRLEYVRLDQLPRLKSIDSSDTSRARFSNNFTNTIHDQLQQGPTIGACLSFLQYRTKLQKLEIKGCETVMEVFMFSTLESLIQLKELEVTRCKAMQVIVKEENDGTSSKVVVFRRLKTLILDDLPNLKGFFLGRNKFEWPLLENVKISGCPQLMTFTAGNSITPKLKHIRTSLGKYNVACGLNFPGTINVENALVATSSSDPHPTISKGMSWSSFHNLIEINISFKEFGSGSVIPCHALLLLQKLEKIDLQGCHDIKEVFEVVALEAGVSTSDLNESQNDVVQVPNLREVKLSWLRGLKYLWKSNQWMVLEFPNLTTLSLDFCKKLEHVFTCSMVASLVQLQDLKITDCKNIEVIVKEEEEKERVGKVNEIIMLPRLKSLKLSHLPSLKGFCIVKKAFSFPALDTLEIKNCPAVTGFTDGHLVTPELKVIDTDFGMYLVTEDLNSFIKTKQQEGRFYVESEPESEPEDQC